jgi:hypothetical protein
MGEAGNQKYRRLDVCLCSGTTSDDSAQLWWCHNTIRHGMKKIKWLIKQTTSITNDPWKYKHHPQTDESNWHPQPRLLSYLFLKWTSWKCDNFHKRADFHYSEWSTRSCVDEPQCNSQFLAIVTQMIHLFFHIMWNIFNIMHILASFMSLDNLCYSIWISIIWGSII